MPRAWSKGWLNSWDHSLLLLRSRVWFPACTWWLPTTCKSSPRGSNTLFWSPQTPYMYMVYIHAGRQNIHTQKMNLTFFFFNWIFVLASGIFLSPSDCITLLLALSFQTHPVSGSTGVLWFQHQPSCSHSKHFTHEPLLQPHAAENLNHGLFLMSSDNDFITLHRHEQESARPHPYTLLNTCSCFCLLGDRNWPSWREGVKDTPVIMECSTIASWGWITVIMETISRNMVALGEVRPQKVVVQDETLSSWILADSLRPGGGVVWVGEDARGDVSWER